MIPYESIFSVLLGCFSILLCKFLYFLTFLYEKIRILCFAMILHNFLSCFCNSPPVLVSRDYTTLAQWSDVLLDVNFYLFSYMIYRVNLLGSDIRFLFLPLKTLASLRYIRRLVSDSSIRNFFCEILIPPF